METTLTTTITATVLRYKRSYKVLFPFHEALIQTFKDLDSDKRKFNKDDNLPGWVVGKEGLFDVMLRWKGDPSIVWEFKPAELFEEFKQQAFAIRELRMQRNQLLRAMDTRNEFALQRKDELRADKSYKLPFFDEVKRPGTTIDFYYHQHMTTAWLIERQGGILAAEMGLGKTFVFCMAALRLCPPGRKVLIIAPKSLVLGIKDDLINLLPQKWYFLGYGRKQPHTPEESQFILCSYSYFGRNKFNIQKDLVPYGVDDPAVVVLDESHLAKNHASLTFKNINEALGGGKRSFILSSGTPIKSHGREIWTQLHLLDPFYFNSRTQFEKDYCGAFLDPYWKRIAYDPQLEKRQELNSLLQPYMFRVRKEDVLNLPPKVYRKLVIPLSTAERKAYETFKADIRNQLLETGSEAVALTLIGKLRQYCAAQKLAYVTELVDRHNEEGEKVVLIDQFKETIEQLSQVYKQRAVVHTGAQDIDQRRAAVQLFQRDRVAGVSTGVDNFLGTTDTCKYGLTLTASHILYLITQAWTPAECDQVYDRCHRVSQDRTVLIMLPILEDTIDDYVYERLETKRGAVLEIIDNMSYVGDMPTSMFQDVLKYLKVPKSYKKGS